MDHGDPGLARGILDDRNQDARRGGAGTRPGAFAHRGLCSSRTGQGIDGVIQGGKNQKQRFHPRNFHEQHNTFVDAAEHNPLTGLLP